MFFSFVLYLILTYLPTESGIKTLKMDIFQSKKVNVRGFKRQVAPSPPAEDEVGGKRGMGSVLLLT